MKKIMVMLGAVLTACLIQAAVVNLNFSNMSGIDSGSYFFVFDPAKQSEVTAALGACNDSTLNTLTEMALYRGQVTNKGRAIAEACNVGSCQSVLFVVVNGDFQNGTSYLYQTFDVSDSLYSVPAVNDTVKFCGCEGATAGTMAGGTTTEDPAVTPETPAEEPETPVEEPVVEEPEDELEAVQLWEGGPYFATCNVGATQPTDYGYYFWWGDTVGYTNTYGQATSSKTGKWYSVADGTTQIKFTNSLSPANSTTKMTSQQLKDAGYIDGVDAPSCLNAAHDAATAHWGVQWRMPTDAELTELINKINDGIVEKSWIKGTNGVNGVLFTGTGAYGQRSIFLPAAGYGMSSVFQSPGSICVYWSSTPIYDASATGYDASVTDNAWGISVGSSTFRNSYPCRSNGNPVRPVLATPPPPKFAVAIASGITGGTVTANKTKAAENGKVSLTVTPAEDFALDTLEVYKTDDPTTKVTVTDNQFTMPAYAVTVSATFAAAGNSTTIAATEHGTVTADRTKKVPEGETVTLTATPDAGYALNTITVTAANGDAVTLDDGNAFKMPAGGATVSATFAAQNQSITKGEIAHGTVEVAASAKTDEMVAITVTPEAGYELAQIRIRGENNQVVEVTDGQFKMPPAGVTVEAEFAAADQSITKAEMTHGTIEVPANAKTDETVTLTVTPEAGYALAQIRIWGENNQLVDVTDNTFTMPPSGVTITATFAAVDQAITKAEMTHGTVSVPASAKTGALVTLTVTPDEGCALDTITVTAANGDALELDDGNAFIMPAGGVTISATFTELLAITDVKAQQRYPWNGKVDISYTVKGAAEGGETLTVMASNTVDGTVYTATSAALIGTPDLTPGTHKLVWDLDAQGLQLKTSSILFGLSVSGGMQNLMADGAVEVKRGGWNGDGMRSNGMFNTDASAATSVYNSVLGTWYTGAANGLFKLKPNSVYVHTFVDPATTAWINKKYSFLQADARVFTNLEKQEAATVMVGSTTKSAEQIQADYDKNKQWATTGWNTSSQQKAGFDGVAWYDKTTKRTVMIFTTGNEDSYLGLCYRINGGNVLASASDEVRAAVVESIINGELYRMGDSDGTKTAQALREAGIADVLTSDTSDQPSAGSAGEVLSVYSDEVSVDTLGGSREAAASETIRFSPAWETEEAGATAVVTIDGVEASKSAETGAYVWTPKPKLGGQVEMTHQVFIDGVQAGATLTASFTVPEPPSYNTTIAAVEHGKVTADRTEKILEGEKVTLTATPDDGYALRMITVTGANDEAIALDEDNSFIMPVGGVKIAATFADARFEGKVRLEPNSTYIYSMTVPENVWDAANGEFLQALVRLYTGDGCALAFASALTGEGETTAKSAGFSAKSEMSVTEGLRKTTITLKTGNTASYAAFSADSVGADFGNPDSDKRAAAQRALKFATLAKATVSSGGTVKVGGDNILSDKGVSLVNGKYHAQNGYTLVDGNPLDYGWKLVSNDNNTDATFRGTWDVEPNSEYTLTLAVPEDAWDLSKGQYLQVEVRVYTAVPDKKSLPPIMLGSRSASEKAATDPKVKGDVREDYVKEDGTTGYKYPNGNGYNTGTGGEDGKYEAESWMTVREDGMVETKIVMKTGAEGGHLAINFFAYGSGWQINNRFALGEKAAREMTLVMTPKDAEVEVATETESTFACGEDLGDASVTSTETWLTGFDVGAGLWSDASATLLTEEDAYSTDGVAQFTPQATQSETPAYVKEILGIAADAALTTDVTESDDTNKIAVAAANVNVETSGDLFDVSFALDKVNADGSPIATNIAESLKNDGLSVDLTKGNPTGYYRSRVIVKQRNGKFRKEVPAENIVGVIKQTQAVTNAIVSVPWANIAPGEDQDIPVSKILKTDSLSNGDEIRVYAPGSSTCKSYTLQDGVWGEIKTFQVAASGQGTLKDTPAASEVTLPRGSAIWLIRKDPENPYYLCGQSNGTDESKVEVVRGPNLIGATGLGDYNFNDHIFGATSGDSIIVPVEGGAPKRFEFKDDSWGRWASVPGKTVKDRYGNVTTSYKTVWKVDDAFVAPGTGFWLHNNSGKITVK